MAEPSVRKPALDGTLRERPLPRLLQQLHRKKFTGHFVIADQTRDESHVYMRDGWPVHVHRPVDTDRLDRLLVEYGVVSTDVVALASAQVGPGQRLGDVLERMGVLDRAKLAQALKAQVVRKLTRLFFVAEGTYAVFVEPHKYGEGDELALMRVDPRSVLYPGIRASYSLSRVTQEVARLVGQRFRLREVSDAYIAAMGVPTDEATVEALRGGWLTLDDLDAITSRPLEVRSVVLALYYGDLLEREAIAPVPEPEPDSAVPRAIHPSSASDVPVPTAGESAAQPAASSGVPASPLRTTGTRPLISVSPPPPPRSSPASGIPVAPASPTNTAPFFSASGKVAATAEPPRAVSAILSSTPRSEPVPAKPASPPSRPTFSPEALRASIEEMGRRLSKGTHFELLGVGQNASADEVQSAFLKAARQFHPDRLIGAGLKDMQPMAERILARVNEAAMVLGDAKRRAEYVASLAAPASSAGSASPGPSIPGILEAENLFLKGEVFLKKGDHAKAIESFAAAVRGNPSEPQYRAYLAWARFDDPRARKETISRETLKIIVEVLRERPKFVRGFYWVGLLWKFLNEPDKAAQAFRETVALDASFIDASRELRLIEMRKNKQSGNGPGGKPGSGGGLMGKLFKR